MATPPVNRRPGVDASIVQSDWVRGYDGPQVTDDPCDIILSNGRNEVDGRVSDLFVWNRTADRDQPMFIFVTGSDFTAPDATFGIYAGVVPDPNGIITDTIGSVYISNSPAALWQNQDGADTWKVISDALGGENLEETLAIGNFTGDNNIVLSKIVGGVFLQGEDTSDTSGGGDLGIRGGNESGATGRGGHVLMQGGTSAGGNSGAFFFSTFSPGGTGFSGGFHFSTGDTTGGGDSGDFDVTLGKGAQGGEFLFSGGDGANVGGDRGGRIQLLAGNSPADGDGGRINIASGSPGAPIVFSNSFNPGRAGQINIQGGNSASAETGGTVFLRGGQGGSAGGTGGKIILEGGPGGGGADDGEIEARGIFFGTNYLRDDGDPNVLGKTAPEGSIYQRETAGFGQAWVNVDGTGTGWAQLLTAGGGIVSALTQIQWGSLTAGSDVFGTDELAADGVLWATNAADIAYEVTNSKQLFGGYDGTPALFLGAAAASTAGVWIGTLLSRTSHSRLVFKFGVPSILADQRIFVGCTRAAGGNNVPTQLGSNNPGGDWFGLWKKTGETNFRFQAQGVGNDSVLSSVTVVEQQVYYVLFDLLDDASGGVTITILNDSYTQLDQHTFSPLNSLIGDGTSLRFIAGTGSSGLGNSLALNMISVVTRTDLAEAAFAGGMAGFSPPLSQVLLAGNETGASNILIDHNQGLFGKDDDDGTDGATLLLISGNTTDIASATGSLAARSADNSIAGFTGRTGNVLVKSGTVSDGTNTASADTGDLTLTSGASLGASGTTGSVLINSGAFLFGGGGALATTGDIDIGVGGGVSTSAKPGALRLQGGITSLNGTTGGNIEVTTGGNTTNGDSGNLTLSTAAAGSPDGGTGDITITAGIAGTNSGNGGGVVVSGGFGRSAGAASGNLVLGAGFAFLGSGADGGDVSILSGNSELAQGGNIEFTTGGSTIGGFRGGDFIFNPGTGPAGDGTVIINGKLTVTGLIDPTGLILTGQALAPDTVNPGDGMLWVDNTGANTILNYTDDANVTIQLGAGGGGAGTLEDTLIAGNTTGLLPLLISANDFTGIIGEDSAITDGGNINISTGSSLAGAGGMGGRFQVTTGDADPTGNGAGGLLRLRTSEGAGTGAGGEFFCSTGDGGATDGWGGHFNAVLGEGQGAGDGGSFLFNAGNGGATGGGGNIVLTPGTGNGGGTDGIVQVTGDAYVTGDLTVDGVIDPMGIGFTPQGANPIPLPGVNGLAGSVWVNGAGELIFTNIGVGDLNISTSIATGVGSLAATLGVGSTTGANGIEFSTTSPGITGSDNAGGQGADININTGNSTGGGGEGGWFVVRTGDPDPAGANGGLISHRTSDGAVGGNGGEISFQSGDGGVTNGGGGHFNVFLGVGGGTGVGGSFLFAAGDGGGAGGDGGNLVVTLGNAAAASGAGGSFSLTAGNSFGPTNGGGFTLTAGEGGGGTGAGDGGNILLEGGGQTVGGFGGYGGVDILGGGTSGLPPSAPGDVRLFASPSATTNLGASLTLNSGDSGKPGKGGFFGGDASGGTGAPGGSVEVRAGLGDGAGAGGTLTLKSGVSGATGAGGPILVEAGAGNDVNDGGAVTINSGSIFGTGTSGDVTVQVGSSSGIATSTAGSLFLLGGDRLNGDVALAGSVIVQAGGNGAGPATVVGGKTTIAGGDLRTLGAGFSIPVSGQGGLTEVRGGASAGTVDGGSVSIIGGPGGDTAAGGANGGSVFIAGRTAEAGTDGDGGVVNIDGGAGNGAGDGGAITITAGHAGATTGDAGNVNIAAGDIAHGDTAGLTTISGGGGTGGGAVTGQGGSLVLQGGNIGTPPAPFAFYVAGQGGGVSVRGGASTGTADGGGVGIQGGLGGTTPAGGAKGGSVTVRGAPASAGTDGDGGSVIISAGAGNGTGVPGQITLGNAGAGDTLNFDSPAMKIGTFVFAGGAGMGPSAIAYASFTQGFGGPPLTAPTAPPRSVQFTLETAGGASAAISPGTLISAFPGGLVVDLSAAVAVGDKLHMVLYL